MSRQPAVIVDMDGTLCDVSAVVHLQAEPDGFTAFHEACAQCPPHPAVIDWCLDYHMRGHQILIVTGRDAWWARFTAASANARATLQARVRASTVLDAGNTPDLERIADSLLAFRPEAWVLGSGVPIVGARVPVVPEGNSLTALKALRPRLEALRGRCAAQAETIRCDDAGMCVTLRCA